MKFFWVFFLFRLFFFSSFFFSQRGGEPPTKQNESFISDQTTRSLQPRIIAGSWERIQRKKEWFPSPGIIAFLWPPKLIEGGKKKNSKQSNTNNALFSLRRHCCFREVGGGVCSGVPALWHGVPCSALGFLSKSCMLLLQCLPCPASLLWCLLFPSPILFPLSFSSPPAPPPLHLYQQLMKQAGRNPIRTVIKFT